MNNILYLDTSLSHLGVGLSIDGKVVFKEYYDAERKQSELLIPTIQRALETGKISLLDITALYVTRGPGSYTGTRIALAVSKTLGVIVPNLKIYPVSTLLALGYHPNTKFCAISSCRNNNVYFAAYDDVAIVYEEKKITEDVMKEVIASLPGYVLRGSCESVFQHLIPGNTLEGLIALTGKILVLEDNLALTPRYEE